MLNMEEKKEFLDAIEEVNDDKNILDDWFLEELAKHKARCQRDYAMKEGREEGLKQGLKQGAQSKQLEIIQNMLINGLDYDMISTVTGKTTEEIKEIEENI